MIVVLVLAVAILYGTGVYLLLQRNLSRIVIGLALLGVSFRWVCLVAAVLFTVSYVRAREY